MMCDTSTVYTVPGHTVVYPACGEYQAGATCRLQTAFPRTEKNECTETAREAL